jgi:hypothetical protein
MSRVPRLGLLVKEPMSAPPTMCNSASVAATVEGDR